jgi:DNA invertase Pin-like site-specific DNA recombinase
MHVLLINERPAAWVGQSAGREIGQGEKKGRVKMAGFVSYLRVSTDRQGRSGLGLEAQRAAVSEFVRSRGGEIVQEYIEVESGKRNDRPQLDMALKHAKKEGVTLVIAKLDRLARNVAFIANLLESGAEVTAADMPEANRFLLHVMAAVAEHEAQAISDRTKAALAAAKARGQKLGWSNPAREDLERATIASVEARMAAADQHAETVRPIIEDLRGRGLTLIQVAETLNARGIPTARGGGWHTSTVRNALARS